MYAGRVYICAYQSKPTVARLSRLLSRCTRLCVARRAVCVSSLKVQRVDGKCQVSTGLEQGYYRVTTGLDTIKKWFIEKIMFLKNPSCLTGGRVSFRNN